MYSRSMALPYFCEYPKFLQISQGTAMALKTHPRPNFERAGETGRRELFLSKPTVHECSHSRLRGGKKALVQQPVRLVCK